MKLFTLLLLALVGPVAGFLPSNKAHASFVQAATRKPVVLSAFRDFQPHELTTTEASSSSTPLSVAIAGFCTGLMTFTSCAFAGEEIEMAELPPPWVPAIFAVVLLVGVGVLTGSLGNVIDEEAQLGMQSGARARKEIERSKSSYFKKK